MLSCEEIFEFPAQFWSWMTRRRSVSPLIFALCGIIFVFCLTGIYIAHKYGYHNEPMSTRLLEAFLWVSFVIDTWVLGVLYMNRREYNRYVTAYEEL